MEGDCGEHQLHPFEQRGLVHNQQAHRSKKKSSTKQANAPRASEVATAFVNNGKFKNHDKALTRKVQERLRKPSVDDQLCQAFTPAEMTKALKTLKAGKVPGSDDFHPEYIIHLHERVIQWLRIFISVCLSTQTIPKMWRKAKVIGILKPNKAANEAKSYRPISLLCTLYKLTERLVLYRISHQVDQFLSEEQAGFREGRCTTDQVTLLIDDIEARFERNDKCGAVLIDLSAAYDSVWHRGLKLKLNNVIPYKSLVNFVMTMIASRGFIMYVGADRSKQRFPKNGVP